MNRRLYALHRWLSAAAFLQLAIWTASGAIFAFLPIETVRGPFVENAHLGTLDASSVLLPPEALARAAISEPFELALRASATGQFWIVRAKGRTLRFDAATGAPAPVTRDEAIATARRDQAGAPAARAATLLGSAPVEYRGKPVPAWRVELEGAAGTVVYVDATTEEVTARRSDLWRTHDFFWSLHIMDYRERETFNHWLLRGAALFALVTVMSGLALWVVRASRWLGARRGNRRSGDS